MTKAELRTDVFRRLAEADPSRHVFWTVADVDTAIDETYAELADQTECYERAITIDLLSGRPYYDLRTVVPEAVLSIGPAYNETTNRWLIGSSVRDLDGADRRWERVTGTPQRTFLRGLHWLGLYPRVTADVGTIRQYYTALPPALGDNDEPLFPSQFHVALVEGALCDLWAQDGEAQRAEAAWQAYLAIETALEAWVAERGTIPAHRGYGATPW